MVRKNGKHVCNVCGDSFDSAPSLGTHGMIHDEEVITGVECECMICGKTEYVNSYDAEKYETCSYECAGKLRSKRQSNKEIVACKICGKEERVPPSRAETYVTCSDECQAEHLSDVNSGKDHYRYKNPDKSVCEVCGDTFEHKPSRDAITCSEECKYKRREGKFTGTDNYMFKEVDIETIIERYKDGESAKTISQDFDMSFPGIIDRLHKRDDVEVRDAGYPKDIETLKGHNVRSDYERKVADFLFENDVDYQYEPYKMGPYKPDFIIDGVVVEMWGLAGSDEYDERRKEKERWYAENKIECVGVEPDDLDNLRERLSMFL